ncbi:hypothetical protein ABG067_007887, partial [Albugo candida]
MNTSNDNITFLPSEIENTPDLKKLFGDVHKLIDKYLEEHPEADDKSTRRFVAGDVCYEDLDELKNSFIIPPKKEQRAPTTWNLYVSEQLLLKKNMNEISEKYNSMKRDRTEDFLRLENECQLKKQRMVEKQEEEKESPTIRMKQYLDDVTSLTMFCDAMYENYKTSILVYGATDTVYSKVYCPFQHSNSGNKCLYIALAKRAEHILLDYTERKDLQFILNDIISVYGEKASYYRRGYVSASSNTASKSNKDDLVNQFLQQARLALKEATGKEKVTRVPWTKIIGNTESDYAITGWPETITMPIEKKKFEPYNLSIEELQQLTQLFKEKKLKIVRN